MLGYKSRVEKYSVDESGGVENLCFVLCYSAKANCKTELNISLLQTTLLKSRYSTLVADQALNFINNTLKPFVLKIINGAATNLTFPYKSHPKPPKEMPLPQQPSVIIHLPKVIPQMRGEVYEKIARGHFFGKHHNRVVLAKVILGQLVQGLANYYDRFFNLPYQFRLWNIL